MLQLIDAVGVDLLSKRCFLVERLESLLHFLMGVHEVQNKGIVLVGAGTVQPRKGLNSLDIFQFLIHDHGVQQGFIEPGLILLCHDQDVEVVTELIFGLGIGDGCAVLADIQP